MKIIDCESVESAYRSLENITGLGTDQLNTIFDKYERRDLHFDDHEDDRDPLIAEIKERGNDIVVDEVYGFHVTRVPAGTTFEDGLLPSHLVLAKFWDILYSVVEQDISKEEFDRFKELFNLTGDALERYPKRRAIGLVQDKMNDPVLCGPCGMVVREVAFFPEKVKNRNFFTIPEFVSDICEVFDHEYDLTLTGRYQNIFRRCIVKYKSRRHPAAYYDVLVAYAFYKYKGLDFDETLKGTLENGGNVVGPEDILKIEWIDN